MVQLPHRVIDRQVAQAHHAVLDLAVFVHHRVLDLHIIDLIAEVCHRLLWLFTAVAVRVLDVPQNAAGLRVRLADEVSQQRRVGKQAAAFHQHPHIFIPGVIAQRAVALLRRLQVGRDRLWVQRQQYAYKGNPIFCGKIDLVFSLLQLTFPFLAALGAAESDR